MGKMLVNYCLVVLGAESTIKVGYLPAVAYRSAVCRSEQLKDIICVFE